VVIACASDTPAGAEAAIRALNHGALEVLLHGTDRLSHDADGWAKDLAKLCAELRIGEHAEEIPSAFAPSPFGRRFDVVAIGARSGGPPVLEAILSEVGPSFSCPIVISQRLPGAFTRALAERLDGAGAICVVHGEGGMPLLPGTAYVVPGGKVGCVRALGAGPMRLEVRASSDGAAVGPVDELFVSCARLAGRVCLGIVLSGAGGDGARGTEALLGAGGAVMAQDPTSCAAEGMPLGALRRGAAAATPLRIAAVLEGMAEARSRAA
jgi:two-component system chemotaxis response regulator CheB